MKNQSILYAVVMVVLACFGCDEDEAQEAGKGTLVMHFNLFTYTGTNGADGRPEKIPATCDEAHVIQISVDLIECHDLGCAAYDWEEGGTHCAWAVPDFEVEYPEGFYDIARLQLVGDGASEMQFQCVNAGGPITMESWTNSIDIPGMITIEAGVETTDALPALDCVVNTIGYTQCGDPGFFYAPFCQEIVDRTDCPGTWGQSLCADHEAVSAEAGCQDLWHSSLCCVDDVIDPCNQGRECFSSYHACLEPYCDTNPNVWLCGYLEAEGAFD